MTTMREALGIAGKRKVTLGDVHRALKAKRKSPKTMAAFMRAARGWRQAK